MYKHGLKRLVVKKYSEEFFLLMKNTYLSVIFRLKMERVWNNK